MNYDTYLFSCLLKLYNSEFEQLPYDIQYEKINYLYELFENSKYNDIKRGLYDCLIDYFSDGNFLIN